MKKNIHFIDPYFKNPVHPITIDLIGVGGTGSLILTRLARIDYALKKMNQMPLKVRAFDFDKVDETNIGRQNFNPLDIGTNKAINLISKINTTFGLDWIAKDEKVNENYYSKANIIIGSVDNITTRKIITKKLREQINIRNGFSNFYYIDSGNGSNFGQVILGSKEIEQPNSKKYNTIGKLKTVTELYELNKYNNKKIQGDGCNLSFSQKLEEQELFINELMALYVVNTIWDILTKNLIDYSGIFINFDNINKIKL